MFTHLTDGLVKLIAIALWVVAAIQSKKVLPGQEETLGFVLSGVCAALLWWFLLRPLSSWVYARTRLGARLSFSQARRASVLFSPVTWIYWQPLLEVRQLPRSERAAAIDAAASECAAYYHARWARWSQASPWIWFVRAALVALLGGALTAAITDAWPFDWLADLQARLFDGWYIKDVNIAIAVVVPTTAMLLLEKRLGNFDPK